MVLSPRSVLAGPRKLPRDATYAKHRVPDEGQRKHRTINTGIIKSSCDVIALHRPGLRAVSTLNVAPRSNVGSHWVGGNLASGAIPAVRPLVRERGLGLICDLLESVQIMHRQIGQHLAINRHGGLAQPIDQTTIG